MVPEGRFELPQPCGRYHLKVVRLPVSPPGQNELLNKYNDFLAFFQELDSFYPTI